MADEALSWWQNEMVAPDAKARECPHCHNFYIRPCSEAEYKSCQNYKFALKRAALPPKLEPVKVKRTRQPKKEEWEL